jgi:hypothetical protein
MADITKCYGRECPIKPTCYRYTAPSSEYRQAFIEPPFEITEDGQILCNMYWGDEQQNLMNHLISITQGKEK